MHNTTKALRTRTCFKVIIFIEVFFNAIQKKVFQEIETLKKITNPTQKIRQSSRT